MRIKKGVDLCGLKPEMIPAFLAVAHVFANTRYSGGCPVITSVVEGKHSPKSKHYRGFAIDVRTHMGRGTRMRIWRALKESLPGFDVVDEGSHIHIEWDPVR